MVPGGGAEEKAPSPQPSPLPSSPAQAAGPGLALPPGPSSLHPHPSPSFPPPLTEPEPAAMRRGFRPGAERKTREPPRTGTASTTPEELFGGSGGGGWGERSKSRVEDPRNACAVWRGLRSRGIIQGCGYDFLFQFRLFLVLVVRILLVCPSSFAFLCSLGPLTCRLLVPLWRFLLMLWFPWQLLAVALDLREPVAALTDVDLRAKSDSG